MPILYRTDGSKIGQPAAIAAALAPLKVTLDHWPIPDNAPLHTLLAKSALEDAEKTQTLDALQAYFLKLKESQGYQTCDLVVLYPGMSGLEQALAKFHRCHTHADDEVRYIIDGEGIFGFVLPDGKQVEVVVEAGDFINVPKDVEHWFHLTPSQRIKAVRYFTDTAGWVPQYTGTTIAFAPNKATASTIRTVNTYQWNAQDYAQNSSEQQRWARELFAKLKLTGNERILDLGCGDGKVTAELARQVPQGWVLGIDNSPHMIALANTLHPAKTHPNLRFQLGDASAITQALGLDTTPAPQNKASDSTNNNESATHGATNGKSEGHRFDRIFSNAALHWIVDHRPLLRGITTALAPDGRVLLQMGGKGNAQDVVDIVETLIQEEPWRGYFHHFTFPYGFHTPNDYRCWLTDAGLKPIRVELIEKTMTHQGQEGLAGWLRTTWMPYLERIPATSHDAFIIAVMDAYLDRFPPDREGTVQLSMVRLEVEAVHATQTMTANFDS